MPLGQTRKLRSRKVKYLAQYPTNSKEQSRDLESSVFVPKSMLAFNIQRFPSIGGCTAPC